MMGLRVTLCGPSPAWHWGMNSGPPARAALVWPILSQPEALGASCTTAWGSPSDRTLQAGPRLDQGSPYTKL